MPVSHPIKGYTFCSKNPFMLFSGDKATYSGLGKCVAPLLRLAAPVVASQASALLVNLADTFMVGRLGEVELAAVAFSGNLSVPFMFFGIGIGAAITPLVGRRFGRGDLSSIGSLVAHVRSLHWRIVIFQVLMLSLLAILMPYMGQPAEVVDIAQLYLAIYAASMVGQQMFVCSRTIIEGLQDTASPMIIGLVANILNIILNYVFIFGIGDFEGYGPYGAAISTLIARVLMWAAMEVVLRKRLRSMGITPMHMRRGLTRKLFFTGLPVGMQTVIECFGFAFGGIMMGWISTAAIAAHQVVNLFTSTTFLMASGVGTAVTIKVSIYVGAGNMTLARRYAVTGLLFAGAFMTFTGVMLVLVRNILPGCVIDSPDALAIAANLMVAGAVFQIFDGLQATSIAALRGFGDYTFPAKVATIAYAATCVPVGFICAFVVGLGPVGVWCGFVAGLSLATFLLIPRLRKRYL